MSKVLILSFVQMVIGQIFGRTRYLRQLVQKEKMIVLAHSLVG